jgi:hypothetical protein
MRNAGAIGRRVTPNPFNEDGGSVELRARLVRSEDSAGPQLLVREVGNVHLAVARIYEHSVLVDHRSEGTLRGLPQSEHKPKTIRAFYGYL